MENKHLLSPEDQDAVDELISGLLALRFDQAKLMAKMLDGVLDAIPSQAPCSLLQLNRFFSEIDQMTGERGKVLSVIHRNKPPQFIVTLWEKFLLRSASEIEEALYKQRGDGKLGVARLCDLMSEEQWKKTRLYYVSKVARVRDLAYLWIRCGDDDIWAICLRRKNHEPLFSQRDVAFLREFGESFYRLRRFWYLEKLRVLSKRERQVIGLLIEGKTAEESAVFLKISPHTYNEHLKKIRKKLQAQNALDVLRKLENE